MSRKAKIATLVVAIFAVVVVDTGPATAANNPVVAENLLPGTTSWALNSAANDVNMDIKGFASLTSVNLGQTIDFKVSVSTAQTYTIEIYRMGYYQGNGGRLVTSLGPFAGTTQPAPVVDPALGTVTAPWAVGTSLTIPASWTSGAYLAKLVRADGRDNHIPFVIRDDARRADILAQLPYMTYQAYNNFPDDGATGKSLYSFNSYGPVPTASVTGNDEALKVSFDRPYLGTGSTEFFKWDYYAIRWLEKEGYDLSYSTNIDTHQSGASITNHKVFLALGHDEYWSTEMYDAAEAARDHPAGDTDLAFLGADNIYWRTTVEASAVTGQPNRLIGSPKLVGYRWRDSGPAGAARPEQGLMGVQYKGPYWDTSVYGPAFPPLVVQNSSHFVWQGTGMSNGSQIPGLAGYEIDSYSSSIPVNGTQTLLSDSPFITQNQNTSIYQAPSTSWVFAAGTFNWSWGLGKSGVPGGEHPAIQQATRNVLDKFLESCTPPANDDFANAITLSGTPATTAADNTCATAQAGENDHSDGSTGGSANKSVWWEWTAPATGQVVFDTAGSDFDNAIGVYTGSPVGSLVPVGNNRTPGNTSQVAINVTQGTVYKIAIDSWLAEISGTAVLNIAHPKLTVISPGCSVYDSTSGDGPLVPGTPRLVQVTGAALCVPSGATSVIFTVTAKNPQGVGNLRLSSAGVAPIGGVVTYMGNGLNITNTVTVPLSPAGAVDVAANNSQSDVRLVAVGFYSHAGTLTHFPLTPCAVADSRSMGSPWPSGSFEGPFTSASAYPDIQVGGVFSSAQGGGNTDCGVPVTADAVLVNVVAIQESRTGSLAVGAGGTTPSEPTTNFAPVGFNNAAVAVVPLDASGKIAVNILGTGSVHVRLVVLGYLDTDSGQAYSPVNPCAAFDSRDSLLGDTNPAAGSFAGPRNSGAAGVTTYKVTGTIPAPQGGETSCGVPDGAGAVLINLVAIQSTAAGNFRAFATGTTPTGGVLNFGALVPPLNNSNAVVVPLDALGQMDVFVNTAANDGSPIVHARGVVLGYFD